MEENRKEIAWSMDEQILFQIGNLLALANDNYAVGRYDMVYDYLRTCKYCFIQSLTQDERNKLKDIEKNTSPKILAFRLMRDRNHWENNVDVKADKERYYNILIKMHGKGAKEQVEQYREMIMDLLDQYGYLSKKKKDKTRLSI